MNSNNKYTALKLTYQQKLMDNIQSDIASLKHIFPITDVALIVRMSFTHFQFQLEDTSIIYKIQFNQENKNKIFNMFEPFVDSIADFNSNLEHLCQKNCTLSFRQAMIDIVDTEGFESIYINDNSVKASGPVCTYDDFELFNPILLNDLKDLSLQLDNVRKHMDYPAFIITENIHTIIDVTKHLDIAKEKTEVPEFFAFNMIENYKA